MGLKGKIFKFMSDILNDGSYDKLYTQAKSTSACGLPKGFFNSYVLAGLLMATYHFIVAFFYSYVRIKGDRTYSL